MKPVFTTYNYNYTFTAKPTKNIIPPIVKEPFKEVPKGTKNAYYYRKLGVNWACHVTGYSKSN